MDGNSDKIILREESFPCYDGKSLRGTPRSKIMTLMVRGTGHHAKSGDEVKLIEEYERVMNTRTHNVTIDVE